MTSLVTWLCLKNCFRSLRGRALSIWKQSTRPERYFMWAILKWPVYIWHFKIGHFRVVLYLVFKASLGALPFIWKWGFIHMQITLVFIWKVLHKALLWKRGTRQFGNGLLKELYTEQEGSLGPRWLYLAKHAAKSNENLHVGRHLQARQ